MRQLKAEQSIVYPKIEGKRWQLDSTWSNKDDAKKRAIKVRKVHSRAVVRPVSKRARQVVHRGFDDWGVYHP